MKKLVTNLDASPNKRLYHSIIADYTPELSILELIDNAIDNWQLNKLKKTIISIDFDEIQNSIKIIDNSWWIEENKLKLIVSPWSTWNSWDEESIGIFWVWSKRGVISLAEKIEITTRFWNKKTHFIEYDDKWINDEHNWDINYFEVDDINHWTTIVELSKLRGIHASEILSNIENKVAKVYWLLIDLWLIEITINSKPVKAILPEDNWSYPKDFSPKKLTKKVIFEWQEVVYTIVTWLTKHSSPQWKYWVTFYWNNRLISDYIKDEEVWYITWKAWNPHPTKSLCQVIVYFQWPSKLIPWNSSKSGINYLNTSYKWIISDEIIYSITEYSKASNYLSVLSGSWWKNVIPYNKWIIESINLDTTSISKSYKLPIWKIKQTKIEKIIDNNKKITDKSPWTRWLLESILAVDLMSRQKFEQKNRISLIIIDSNFEIWIKEYLVHNIKIWNKDFNNIKDNRVDVIKRVEVENSINKTLLSNLSKTNYYYIIRNNLIHQKATSTITDRELEEYHNLVKEIFEELFWFKF